MTEKGRLITAKDSLSFTSKSGLTLWPFVQVCMVAHEFSTILSLIFTVQSECLEPSSTLIAIGLLPNSQLTSHYLFPPFHFHFHLLQVHIIDRSLPCHKSYDISDGDQVTANPCASCWQVEVLITQLCL